MIILISLFLLSIQCYQLLQIQNLKSMNSHLSFESMDRNLLFVFKFPNASQHSFIPIISYSPLGQNSYNISSKFPYIESAEQIFYDLDSISSSSDTHLIEVPNYKSLYYNIISEDHIVSGTMEIYSKNHSTCVNECQGYQIAQFTSQSTCNGQCKCQSGLFGSYCQFKKQKLMHNVKSELQLLANKWSYFEIDAVLETKIYAYGVHTPISISLGAAGVYGEEVPNKQSNLLHTYIVITKTIQEMESKHPGLQAINIGLYSTTNQTISLLIEEQQTITLMDGNCIVIAFTALNLVIMLSCFFLIKVCKNNTKIPLRSFRRMRLRRAGSPMLELKPKQFSGKFFNQHFDKFDFKEILKISSSLIDSSGQCVICMEDYSSKPVTITPCYHLFHHECLKKWLMKSLQCPSCRFDFEYSVIVKKNWLSKLQDDIEQGQSEQEQVEEQGEEQEQDTQLAI